MREAGGRVFSLLLSLARQSGAFPSCSSVCSSHCSADSGHRYLVFVAPAVTVS